MKISALLFAFTTLGVTSAAYGQTLAGEYSDKQYLHGKAVFQMSIEGTGNNTQIWFSAGNSDGQGAAPEANGTGKFVGKDKLQFTFEDSCRNSGTGTVNRSGDDIVVSIKPTRVADSRCVGFYADNIRLKRVKK
ncbi:MAG: hypothetical protein ACJ8IQ_07055 [Chthoniobacterales bacterium]|jgi:hypothetical protein